MVLYWIILPIVWVLIHILWRVEVVGLDKVPRDRAIVLAPNHISDLDPVFVLGMILDFSRYRILAKKELFKNPFIDWFLGCLGAVPIDRGKGDTETIDRVIADRGGYPALPHHLRHAGRPHAPILPHPHLFWGADPRRGGKARRPAP